MNVMKLISPDFYLGKLLIGLKSFCEIAWLLLRHPNKENYRFARLVLIVKPRYTMVRNRNLRLLYDLVREVDRRRLAGDIVECGVWNGGSAAIMAAASKVTRSDQKERVIWLFDSFQGLPPPGERDGDLEKGNYFPGWNKGRVELVHSVFNKIEFSAAKLKIVPGWFSQTLNQELVEEIAILHIDADWYDSVKAVLQTLYNRVVPGGFIIFDDYGLWSGCDRAVKDYFVENHMSGLVIRKIGSQGGYFEKPYDDTPLGTNPNKHGNRL